MYLKFNAAWLFWPVAIIGTKAAILFFYIISTVNFTNVYQQRSPGIVSQASKVPRSIVTIYIIFKETIEIGLCTLYYYKQ